MTKSLEKAMAEAWETYKENNIPKDKDNYEYWKDGFRNAIEILNCETCKYYDENESYQTDCHCQNHIEGCIGWHKKENEK
jgi:hypothetical protein